MFQDKNKLSKLSLLISEERIMIVIPLKIVQINIDCKKNPYLDVEFCQM